MPKGKKKLSIPQKVFVKEYIKNGGNGVEAALTAYKTTDRNSAGVIASRNLDKPLIQAQIDHAFEELDQTPKKIIQNISHLANYEELKDLPSASEVLKANVELLKLMRAYPGTKHTSVSVSVTAKLKDMKFEDAKQALVQLRENNDQVTEDS